MKRILFIGTAALVLSTAAALPAHAYEAVFGAASLDGPPAPDGSVNVRNVIRPAEENLPITTILQRPRPDYDPVPIDFASFQLFPSLEVQTQIDDNIFSASRAEETDLVTTFRPQVVAVSNWGRHALQFTGYGNINKYVDNSSEDTNDAVLDLKGRIDIFTKTALELNGGWQRLTENRGSPDTATAGVSPTQFDNYIAGADLTRSLGVLQARVGYDLKSLHYKDVALAGGAGEINNTVRDRNEHTVSAEVAYEITPTVKPYVAFNYNWRNYLETDARNSDGYLAQIGTTLDFGGVILGEVYGGYLQQDYRNLSTGTYRTGIFGGKFLWNVTEMTSVVADLTRRLAETSVAGYASYLDTTGRLSLQHELKRNVLLTGGFGYSRQDFNGDPKRQDDIVDAGISARYFFDQNFYADAAYDYIDRTSDTAAAEYSKNVIMFRVGVQM